MSSAHKFGPILLKCADHHTCFRANGAAELNSMPARLTRPEAMAGTRPPITTLMMRETVCLGGRAFYEPDWLIIASLHPPHPANYTHKTVGPALMGEKEASIIDLS